MKDIKFDGRGLVPAVVQEGCSGKILMVAYMNEEALQRTVESGDAWYYSRSRKALWHKGETSGHFQRVRSIAVRLRRRHDLTDCRPNRRGLPYGP